MRISKLDLGNITELGELVRFVAKTMGEIQTVLNGGIVFSDNFNARIVTQSFTAANTEVGIEHNLGRVPTGYLQLASNAASILYNDREFTRDFVYLKSSAVAEVRIMVF